MNWTWIPALGLVAVLVTLVLASGAAHGIARRWALAAVVAMVVTIIGLLDAVGCGATHLERLPGDPGYCSTLNGSVAGVVGLVSAAIWIVSLIVSIGIASWETWRGRARRSR